MSGVKLLNPLTKSSPLIYYLDSNVFLQGLTKGKLMAEDGK